MAKLLEKAREALKGMRKPAKIELYRLARKSLARGRRELDKTGHADLGPEYEKDRLVKASFPYLRLERIRVATRHSLRVVGASTPQQRRVYRIVEKSAKREEQKRSFGKRLSDQELDRTGEELMEVLGPVKAYLFSEVYRRKLAWLKRLKKMP